MASTSGGITYPDSGGSTRIWEHLQTLATTTQTAINAATPATSTWNSWSPQFDGSVGGFTSVGAGAGQREGFYVRTGDLVHAEFRLQLAAGFTTSAGTFVLMLPVGAYAWGGSVIQGTVGSWTARDDSAPYHFSGSLGLYQSSADRVSFNGSWDGTKPRSRVDSNDPIVWATSDVLSGVLNYRAA